MNNLFIALVTLPEKTKWRAGMAKTRKPKSLLDWQIIDQGKAIMV
jgi:hypothetical protein